MSRYLGMDFPCDNGILAPLHAHRLLPRLDGRSDARSAGFDDLDARLARIGYSPKTLAEQFDLTQA